MRGRRRRVKFVDSAKFFGAFGAEKFGLFLFIQNVKPTGYYSLVVGYDFEKPTGYYSLVDGYGFGKPTGHYSLFEGHGFEKPTGHYSLIDDNVFGARILLAKMP